MRLAAVEVDRIAAQFVGALNMLDRHYKDLAYRGNGPSDELPEQEFVVEDDAVAPGLLMEGAALPHAGGGHLDRGQRGGEPEGGPGHGLGSGNSPVDQVAVGWGQQEQLGLVLRLPGLVVDGSVKQDELDLPFGLPHQQVGHQDEEPGDGWVALQKLPAPDELEPLEDLQELLRFPVGTEEAHVGDVPSEEPAGLHPLPQVQVRVLHRELGSSRQLPLVQLRPGVLEEHAQEPFLAEGQVHGCCRVYNNCCIVYNTTTGSRSGFWEVSGIPFPRARLGVEP